MAAKPKQTAEQVSAKGSIFNDPKVRGIIYQLVLVAGLVYFFWSIVENASSNLEKQNIASGFGFIGNTAGFLQTRHLLNCLPPPHMGRHCSPVC